MTITPSPPGKLPLRLSRDPPSGFPPRQGRSRLPGFGLAIHLFDYKNRDIKIKCSLAQSAIRRAPLS